MVVHHRGAAELAACVASVIAAAGPRRELMVVDCGSRDGGALGVAGRAGVRLLRLPGNRGFAGGANAGILASRGEHVLLLNPDATVRPDTLERLLEVDADFVAPRILLPGGELIDNCGHELYPDGLNWCRGRGERAEGRYAQAEDLLIFSGAAVLARRSALERTGLLESSYFAYGEDADLSLRAARLGLTCRYEPSAVVEHRVGGSFGRSSARKAFLVERNRVAVALTHLPRRWLLASPAWTARRYAAWALPVVAGSGVAKGAGPARGLLPAAALLGLAAGLLRAPDALRSRRGLARAAALDDDVLDAAAWSARLARHRVGISELAVRTMA